MNKLVKRGLACTMAVAVAVSGIVIVEKNSDNVQAASDEYKLVWSDEFNGTELNRNIWNVEVNGSGGGNNERQYYLDDSDNISVSNGTLKIQALKESYGGKQYTSGRINSNNKAEFKYGRIEARMKLPSFTGSWPAFWMLGANYEKVGWPRCGEIDIMEAVNTENYTNGYVHWQVESPEYTGQGDSGTSAQGRMPAGYNRTDWHTYGIEWNESTMKFYVDNKVFFTQGISESHMSEFRAEQFIIFNLAIGGNWPGFNIDDTAFPAKSLMEVDYVRVYQKESDNGSMSGSGIPKVEVPTEIQTKNVLEGKGAWGAYYDTAGEWAFSDGTITCADSSEYTMNIAKVGNGQWGVQAFINDLDYIEGSKYTYSFDIVSDIDKNVTVKVVGDDSEADIFSMEDISLKAGETYHYSKTIEMPADYNGKLDLYFAFGGGISGETIDQNTSCVITLSNASFVGNVVVELPTQKPTVKPTVAPTTKAPTTKAPTVKKTSIKKITREKNNKKAKITLKKASGVTGYKIQYSRNKKFKKGTVKNVKTKKLTVTIKGLKSNKKYYFRVIGYKKVGKKVYYSQKWSTVKTLKVRKK